MNAYPEKQQYTADDLAAIIAILRDPENGCPWDKVQTHTSIRMNFLEEAYEAVDAIDLDDPELMCEELGDVLMQVAFHAQIEREAGHFTFAEVCDGVCRKLIERHPHIFGGDESIKDWDSLKNKEKGPHAEDFAIWAVMVLIVLALIAGALLHTYLACAFAGQFTQQRMLISIAAYFVIGFAGQMAALVTAFFVALYGYQYFSNINFSTASSIFSYDNSLPFLLLSMLAVFALIALVDALMWALTQWFMTKRLNLA